jgi:predicted DNA-binding protein with PD1-like motif
MKGKLLHNAEGQRTFILVLQTNEEAKSCLERFATAQSIRAAQITGIGAFREATLCYFDWPSKQYQDISVDEQVEVASLIGDIGETADGGPALHVHLVLGRRDGSALAGHLGRGIVRPTLELLITESPAHLRRLKDAETGINLIRL